MVTVIQPRQGNTGTDLLAALNTVLGTIEENRKYGQDEQLKLLSILAKQPGTSIEPVPASQLQQPSFLDFLFGGQPRTLSGAPAARLGNQALQIGKQPALTEGDPLWAPTAAPVTAVPGTETNIFQAPRPQSNIPVPPAPAPAAAPSAAPSGGVDTGFVSRASAKRVDPATSLALKANEGSGPTDVSLRGAVGTFQMKPSTARKYLPPEFTTLTDAELTEALKDDKVSEYLFLEHQKDLEQKFPGRPDLVAAAYFSGEGNIKDGKIVDPTRSDGNMTVQEYVDRFQRRYQMHAARLTPPATNTSMQVAGPGAPAPPTATAPLAPDMSNTTQRLDQAQAGRLTQRDPSLATVPTGPIVTPPSATTAQPPAPTPAEGQPAGPHEDRAIQLTDRRVQANPDAPMVDVPGVGWRSQQWYRDYLARLAPFRSPGLYQTPENIFKYAEAKRKAADDLDKDELQLRKDVQTMREKYPGQSDAFSNVTSQADLAGRAERRVLQPDQLQNAAMQDVRSAIAKAPRDANGTLTPAGAQYLADIAAYWGRYGVKPETFKPMLDAAGVGTAEAVQKERALGPVKTAQAVQQERQLGPVRTAEAVQKEQALLPVRQAQERQRIQAGQQEDPFKGDPMAQVIGNKLSADMGIPVSQFTDKMRQKVLDDAADQKALEAGKTQAAKSEAEAFDKMDVYTRTAALAILKDEGTPVSKISGDQIRRAQAQGDIDRASEQKLRVEAERQGKLNAPVTDPSLLGRYVDLQTGAKHPTGGESIPQMQSKGFVYLDKPQQDTLRNGVSSIRFVDRMQTLLLGGTDYDGSFTGTPGTQFPGIYQGKDEATSLAARAGRSFNVRTGQIYGRTLAQWASIYDRLVESSLGHIGREMGGERGHFTDDDAKRAKRFFADVGLSGKSLATSKPEAEKLFGQVRGLLNDRVSAAVGLQRGDALPWDPQAPTSVAARRQQEQPAPPANAPPTATPAPVTTTAPAAPQESEADAYRRITGQQPQRTP